MNGIEKGEPTVEGVWKGMQGERSRLMNERNRGQEVGQRMEDE